MLRDVDENWRREPWVKTSLKLLPMRTLISFRGKEKLGQGTRTIDFPNSRPHIQCHRSYLEISCRCLVYCGRRPTLLSTVSTFPLTHCLCHQRCRGTSKD